ncbi:MAG: ATP-binding protein, partial [Gemmatimonadota bacterium]
ALVTRRVGAFVVAVVFAAVLLSFLLYTQQQAEVIREDAEVLEQLYALLFPASLAADPEAQAQFTGQAMLRVLNELERLQIPVVVTDTAGNPTSQAYLPFEFREGNPADSARLRDYVEELDRTGDPLELARWNVLVHFGEPQVLRRLRWIPWLQAAALLAVVGGGAWMIFTSFRSERERIWSAMARESAHQMGTPLSSLVGWLEVLESHVPPEREPGEPDLIDEMAADVQRLQKVSLRFELIGRKPELEPVSVRHVVERLRRYFSARLPTLGSAVRFEIEIPPEAPDVLGNETLLEWAFENLIKNSIDAMAGRAGVIGIAWLGPDGRRSVYRVHDTGPGVAPQIRDKLFDIGVTTKERGWGVGLSLTKRIIEDMHDGSIHLENTTEGASFRLELRDVKD